MVRMKTKVSQFPQTRRHQNDVPLDDPMIFFVLGDERFAIQWTVTRLRAQPAEVIPIQTNRPKTRRSGRPDTKQHL